MQSSRESRELVLAGVSSTDQSVVRRFLDGVLADIPNDARADLKLATNELVANAVWHRASSSPIVVDVDLDPGSARVRVSSRGANVADLPDVAEWSIAAPGDEGGRGLGIVRAICDDVIVERTGTQLAITIERRWKP